MTVDAHTLQTLAPLRAIPLADLTDLLELSQELSFAAGEVIFEPGTPNTQALLVVRGRLTVAVDGSGGHERVVGDVWPGEIAGEGAFFERSPVHRARTRAVQPTVGVIITPEVLARGRGTTVQAVMQAHTVAVLARRIRSTNLAIRKAWQEQQLAEARPRGAEAPPTTLLNRLAGLFGAA